MALSDKNLEYLLKEGLVRRSASGEDYIIVKTLHNQRGTQSTAALSSEYAIRIADLISEITEDVNSEDVLFDPAIVGDLSATNVQDALDELTGITTGLQPNYRRYVALLTQTGTSAPVATILENTLGTVSFGYTGVGQYTVTATGALTLNKTDVSFGSVMTSTNDWCSVFVDSSTLTVNGFSINVQDLATTAVNGTLNHTKIEITVYN